MHILRMEESNVVLDGMDPKQLSYELFLVKQKAKQVRLCMSLFLSLLSLSLSLSHSLSC